MESSYVNEASRHDAFVRAAQYIVRLTEQQDVYENLAGLMVNFFKATWVAFASREPSGEINLHHGTPSGRCEEKILTEDVRVTITEVLESGFLATRLLPFPAPSMTCFMPLQEGNQTRHVMLVAHGDDLPLSKELLDTYLAVAGLAGAKIERVNDARELRRHRDHLEELVKERTAELEELNRELESFSYSVSHDLHAPLRAIDGYSRMILRRLGGQFDEETLRQFNLIRSSAQKMGTLIDDLLAFSRLGRKAVTPCDIDMEDLLREVWEDLKAITAGRRIGFKIGAIPRAMGDRTLIKQVFTNLLSNAVKYTRLRDEALIEATGYPKGTENVYCIRDNGAGFDMADYEKLFAVFQRLHDPETFEGTGVGLAIVQRIVHRHGGRVWAEGEAGKGATFHFTLPASPSRRGKCDNPLIAATLEVPQEET